MTAAEISRLAGVTRATVSNWRRRHPDFPAPVGGSETSPTYDLTAVQEWLAARGQLPTGSGVDKLRLALRTSSTNVNALFPLVLVANALPNDELVAVTALPAPQLAQRARALVSPYTDTVPGVNAAVYSADDAGTICALLQCVQEQGPAAALDVLAERAREQGGITGIVQTPAPLAELVVDLVTRPDGSYPATVYDPACGAGNLLVAAGERGAQHIFGQDLSTSQAAHAAVRVALLSSAPTCRVTAGDSLRADNFFDLQADAVLCSPPFGDRDWGHDELAYDPRWAYGLPPKIESELAWVQHSLAHLTPGGMAILLMPPAAADRSAGRRIRAELIRRGALRGVVALPVGATALHVGLHLWLLTRPHERGSAPASVLFVDASNIEGHDVQPDQWTHPTGLEAGHPPRSSPTRRTPVEWQALYRAVVEAWRSFTVGPDGFSTMPGTARAVAVVDLLNESVDLSPARHVRTVPSTMTPAEHANDAYTLSNRLDRAARCLARFSSAAWPATGAERRSWRSAALADLIRGGALVLLRHPAGGRGARGQHSSDTPDEEIKIRPGDVLLPEVLRVRGQAAQVVEGGEGWRALDRGMYLLRPDPRRLDPWFLVGFLSAEDNLHGAATGTSILRLDVRRLRVPLLPLDEQRRYGQAFRHLHALTQAADLAKRLADETTRSLALGLTTGSLSPPDTERATNS
ncbi:N-6 DNA methylase [Dactylosporangium sp. CA-092794]|uniref:N-6 DNA methylase n=1 Tax=Dactylosporangium sp. CA-092794 TaxID=3239929 RepID=UPI003D8EF985